MNHAVILPGGGLKLQATLSSSSSGTGDPVSPHHPITCNGGLRLEHDGRLCCDHSAAPGAGSFGGVSGSGHSPPPSSTPAPTFC